MIRDVINWYQGFERSCRKNQQVVLTNITKPLEALLEASVIPTMVKEGKAEAIMDTLRTYSQLSYVDKEALVRHLASGFGLVFPDTHIFHQLFPEAKKEMNQTLVSVSLGS